MPISIFHEKYSTTTQTRNLATNIAAQVSTEITPLVHLDDPFGGVTLIFSVRDAMLTIRISENGNTIRYEGRNTNGDKFINGVATKSESYSFLGTWLHNFG